MNKNKLKQEIDALTERILKIVQPSIKKAYDQGFEDGVRMGRLGEGMTIDRGEFWRFAETFKRGEEASSGLAGTTTRKPLEV